jgi:hypothetical protein
MRADDDRGLVLWTRASEAVNQGKNRVGVALAHVKGLVTAVTSESAAFFLGLLCAKPKRMANRWERRGRQMTSEIIAALIGAGIALVGGIAGAFLQHFLSLRTDRIKRERDRQEEEARRKQDGREERVIWLRDKQNEADKSEKDGKEREVERLREVLLGSVSSRLAPQDLEKFMEEVEKKYQEDGWKWAERPPEALEIWLRERLQEAGEEWNSQEETQDEPLE